MKKRLLINRCCMIADGAAFKGEYAFVMVDENMDQSYS
jgi:hypothetical protein